MSLLKKIEKILAIIIGLYCLAHGYTLSLLFLCLVEFYFIYTALEENKK